MRLLRIFLGLIFVCLLTVVSQIGGVVFLISLLASGLIDKIISGRWTRLTAKGCSFMAIYLLFAILIVPFAAKLFGRVPLPVFENRNLRPASIWTCLLNRHYVRPQLRDIALKVAGSMNNKYPGIAINYLDANFPFVDKFPLLPHLSHNDGKKLDLSFQYNDRTTGQMTTDIPSFIGYGVCEEPKNGEENKPDDCDKKGFGSIACCEI